VGSVSRGADAVSVVDQLHVDLRALACGRLADNARSSPSLADDVVATGTYRRAMGSSARSEETMAPRREPPRHAATEPLLESGRLGHRGGGD
jgi:hypothetical protein